MVTQYIGLGDNDWGILVYYGTDEENVRDVYNALIALGCPKHEAYKATMAVTHHLNTGLTYSNPELKMSLVCVSDATSADQFVNTTIHEAKHIQSHVCEYFDVDEDSETASYMIGYIVQRMYKMLSMIRKEYYG